MKAVLTMVMTGCLATALIVAQSQSRSAADLYQEALHEQEVKGDLQQAIAMYRTIVERFATDRNVAAKALLGLGQCYEMLGNAEAQKAYERLVRDYADQTEPAVQARTRLASMGGAVSTSKSTMTVRQVWTGAGAAAAISPDGRHLVFAGRPGRALYVRGLLTGQNRPLSMVGWDMERIESAPAFSPDGKLIAYWCTNCGGHGDLRVIALDGSAPRVLYRRDEGAELAPFDWSPDGKNILGVARGQSGTRQIVLVSVADGSVRVLKTLDWGSPQKISLSPDGRYFVYDLPAREGSPERDIFLLGTGGGREVPLVAQASDEHDPVWTPDGSGVVFLGARAGSVDAWFLRVVDGKPQGSPELARQDVGAIVPMGFTRNGSFYYRLQSEKSELFVTALDPASGAITAQPATATQRVVTGPASWSPDGQYLAYLSQRSSVQGEVGATIIVVRSITTGEEKELAPALSNFSIRPSSWSPDGLSLLVPGRDKAGRRGLYRIDARTGDIIAPLLYESVAHPNWFLNGKSIVFIREGGSDAIVLRDLETDHETEVYRPSAPSFLGSCVEVSRDGQRLAFYTRDPETRSSSVMIMSALGEKPRELGPPVKYPKMIDDIWALTPDGRQVLFTTYDRESPLQAHKVWRISVEGGAPQEIRLPMERLDYVGAVSFHPDGRRIAFTSVSSKSEFWMMENFLPPLKAAR